ncbi:MAG: peptide deformylase [Ruminococcus sp.]|nr:peptide deformylase [Ruminococcus sp.]MCM1478541.1 peptide deformylase [Muribaculaceae bacterium]
MALRKIVLKTDEILRKKCKPVEKFDEKLAVLLDDMAETMHKTNGVGLAAPQVGILRRAIVVDVGEGEGLLELVNPEIIKSKGSQRDVEGCLSCPDEWGYVIRPAEIIVRAQDRTGKDVQLKLKDFMARATCHEIDHLDGQLFTDIADEMVDPEDVEKEQAKAARKRKIKRKR